MPTELADRMVGVGVEVSRQLSPATDRPWPHRIAVVLVCATFSLIWVGGLVTTYDAGMAVPDWPSTYGYNLFLYPWQTWLAGPWGLFIEHGHRLLGAAVGLLTIAFSAAVWKCDPRKWMREVAVLALVAVIGQGTLGGVRVLLDDRTFALIHGCTGPAFFALCVLLCVFTSRFWREQSSPEAISMAGRLRGLAVFTAVFAFAQLVLGAHLRHVSASAAPETFQAVVFFHLLMAFVLVVHVVMLACHVFGLPRRVKPLSRPASLLAALTLFQLLLGAATWVAKYSWPAWLGSFRFAAGYTIQAESFWQSMIVTAHVAVGSLILAVSVLVVARVFRLARSVPASAGTGLALMEVIT